MSDPLSVIWHDLECGGYDVDLELWRQLARDHGGSILDVGAGTGRVTLDLARAGHPVTALDLDRELLDALQRRAGDLPVTIVHADARSFALEARFGLCLVPMQTIQLLEGAAERRAFLQRARAHLEPGGVLAIALAVGVEPFDVDAGFPAPLPDVGEIDGTVYCSRPTAVRLHGDRYVLERRREIVDPAGALSTEHDAIWLDFVTPDELENDARAVGLAVAARDLVPETEDYVASTVVMLGG